MILPLILLSIYDITMARPNNVIPNRTQNPLFPVLFFLGLCCPRVFFYLSETSFNFAVNITLTALQNDLLYHKHHT